MEQETYAKQLKKETNFHLRHAVERLREGLFDPIAVRLLTVHIDKLKEVIDQGMQTVESGKPAHLCVCGSYGQGKSHTLTYIQDKTLQKGFVCSMINLDPREIPFFNFRQVYRELIFNLKFPDSDNSLVMQWKTWAEKKIQEEKTDISELLPEEMPHLFRSVLTGLAQKNISLTNRERQLKKHIQFRPREFPYLLAKTLNGDIIPVNRLRQALKYRQVSFYKDASLTCKGNEPYIKMLQSLSLLFRKMGYKGWVISFDEGESITQGSVSARNRSYQFLHNILVPEKSIHSLYSVFAFTEDFFETVKDEDYERIRIRKEVEEPYFNLNYAELWKNLTIYRLQNLSKKEWDELSNKLILLYAKAYYWEHPEEQTLEAMEKRVKETEGHETRFRLKALVDQLDLIYQEYCL